MPTRVKKTKDGCGCLDAAQKEAEPHGFAFDTAIQMDFDAGRGRVAGPFLAVHRIDGAKRKRLPTVTCAYCPFCGKRNP